MVQHSEKGKCYKEPYVISIWIIKNKIKDGIMVNRISPIEEIVNCTLPTRWGEGYEPFTRKSRIIWVQLSKFNQNDKLKEDISKGLKDWIEFFRNPEKIESEDEGMKDAQTLWSKISADEQLKAQQRAQDKYEMDKLSEIATARNIGKEEGLKQGKEAGLVEGEHKKAIETAKNLLAIGLSVEQIAKATGLSIEEVHALT